jgi:hypothetical protein
MWPTSSPIWNRRSAEQDMKIPQGGGKHCERAALVDEAEPQRHLDQQRPDAKRDLQQNGGEQEARAPSRTI